MINDLLQEIQNKNVSVVIATLGGDSLKGTIDSLLTGSKKPDEILICIPDTHAQNAASLASDIIKVIATEVKGQVKQRAYGFTQVRCDLVLQLDDDILLEHDSLSNLVQYLIQLGKGNAVGPVYYNQDTRKCIHELQHGLVKNVFDSVICAAPWDRKKMGIVSSIGLNYGVDPLFCKEALKKVDWLPGGCVLCYKDDLVTEDFFPFTGKAYCEDIYHSLYRKQKGIQLWVATGIDAYIEQPLLEFNKKAVDKVIEIRRYYVDLIQGQRWRLYLYELFARARSKVYNND